MAKAAKMKDISVSQLRAQLLSVIDGICRHKNSVLVTKRGYPVARIVPIEEGESRTILGKLSGTVTEEGDITKPIGRGLW